MTSEISYNSRIIRSQAKKDMLERINPLCVMGEICEFLPVPSPAFAILAVETAAWEINDTTLAPCWVREGRHGTRRGWDGHANVTQPLFVFTVVVSAT